MCAANAAPHKLAEVTAAIDKIGRVTRVAIKPPDTALPVIDKQLAQLFGISERMVRKCRTDPKLRPFMPHPVWIERDWVKAGRLDSEARELAKRLMTPERFAKREPLTLINGTVRILDAVELRPISESERQALRTLRASAARVGVPFKTGAEAEIIPGPGPRHRVGCEEFDIGLQSRGVLAPVPGIRSRSLRHARSAQTVLSYSDVDPRRAERKLTAWRDQQRKAWHEVSLEFADDLPKLRIVTAEPWRHVWKKEPDRGWGGEYEVVACYWARPSSMRIVPLVDGRPPVIAPGAARGLVLERLVGQYLGEIEICRLFAHALPDTIVLRPHQTWPWMATRRVLWAVAPPDGELYDFLRHYRLEQWRTGPLLGRVLINRRHWSRSA